VKQILAIIRPQKIRETKEALIKAGFSAFTATKVLGRGRGNVDFRVLHAAESGTEEAIAQLGDGPLLISKRLMNVVVPDDKAGTLIQTIIDINKTGTAGDGRIFVLPVHETIRIRTGERDTIALQEH
jgi:nitrogen regulatory protein PII 2